MSRFYTGWLKLKYPSRITGEDFWIIFSGLRNELVINIFWKFRLNSLLIAEVIAFLNHLFDISNLHKCGCQKHWKGQWTELFTRRPGWNQQKHLKDCCRTENSSFFCPANCKTPSSSDCVLPCPNTDHFGLLGRSVRWMRIAFWFKQPIASHIMVSAGVWFSGKGRFNFISEKAKLKAKTLHWYFATETGCNCRLQDLYQLASFSNRTKVHVHTMHVWHRTGSPPTAPDSSTSISGYSTHRTRIHWIIMSGEIC